MAGLWLCLFCVFALASAASADDASDKLVFKNGDLLTGKLLSFDPHNGAQWSRPDSKEPITFAAGNLSSIDLGSTSAPVAWQPGACRVRLKGEDLIQGVLVSLDSNSMQLQSPSAGLLVAPRAAVQSISMIPAPQSSIYDGPTGLEGWTQGESALAQINSVPWIYRNGAFYSSKPSAIARDVKLPDMARVEVDLRWQSMFYLNIALYADSLKPVALQAKENEPPFGGFYSLQMNNTMATLLAVQQREPQRTLEPVILPKLGRGTQAHFDIRINKTRGSIALLIDGELVKEWVDPQGFIGQGTILRFVNQGLGPVKVSNIHVTKWDGVIEQRPVTAVPADARDAVRLVDDTLVFGDLISMTNSVLTVSNAQGVSSVPLARVKQLDSTAARVPAKSNASANARVYFGQAGRISLQLERFDNTTLQGINANFGRMQIAPRDVTRVQLLR